MSQKITNSYGGNGGNAFSAGIVNSIGLRGNQDVDAIIINGNKFGGDGGDPSTPGSISFASNEYINYVKICYDNNEYVYYLKITTNLGNSLEIGNNTKGVSTELKNIRLLSVDGRADRYVDKLTLTYIDSYTPSVAQEKATFILSWTPPNTKMTQYVGTELNTLNSYEQISTSMMTLGYSASTEAEFGVTVSATTSLTYQNSDTTTIKNTIQNTLTTASTTETNVLSNQVGVMLVTGQIMQSNDGQYWMYPIGEPQYSVLSMDNLQSFRNTYDLNGLLYEQIPALSDGKTSKYGYTFTEAKQKYSVDNYTSL